MRGCRRRSRVREKQGGDETVKERECVREVRGRGRGGQREGRWRDMKGFKQCERGLKFSIWHFINMFDLST